MKRLIAMLVLGCAANKPAPQDPLNNTAPTGGDPWCS